MGWSAGSRVDLVKLKDAFNERHRRITRKGSAPKAQSSMMIATAVVSGSFFITNSLGCASSGLWFSNSRKEGISLENAPVDLN